MRNNRCAFILVTLLLLVFDIASRGQEKITWNTKNANDWFNKHGWLFEVKAGSVIKYDAFGRTIEPDPSNNSDDTVAHLDLATLEPHESIDKVQFAKAYHANQDRWNKAFSFLQTTDLGKIKPGRYSVDGDSIYALVTEGPGKKEDTTKWEAHRNYIDIHYVIKGREKIGVTSVASAKAVTSYNKERDITFYTAQGKSYIADPGIFFIFFPGEAHRPGLQLNGEESIKKIVIKIRKGE